VSPENVELTRAAYAAFRRRDYDRLLVLLHAEVEFSSLIMDADSRVFRGHAGVREYLDSLLEVLPEWEATVEEIEDFGDSVLVRTLVKAIGAYSGAPVEQVMWQVVRVRDGKVASWHLFRTKEEALEAVGRAG